MSDTQTRLDEIAELNPTRALKKGKMTSFVEMASLPTNSRDIENIAQKEFSGSGSKFKNGDILFARITPCLENGKTAKVAGLQHDEIAHGSTEFIVLSAREPEFDEDYLYYFCRLSEFRNYAKSRMEGTSGRQRVSWQALAEFEFDFPDKEIRKKAADMLKIFDDKIQLNTQTNQTLEAIAQAIFKSWFVDFDPVRAKAAALSEGKSEYEANLAAMSVICGKDTSELNDTEYKALWEIADAFPSELVENAEFGEVPKGWERSTIGESYNVIMGQSPSGETYNEQGNGTLFYQGRAEFGWRFPTPRLFTTNPKRMAKSNDILMSVRAPVGDLNVALENCCIGRGLCALSHKSGEFSFGFYQMKNLKSVLDVFNGEGTVFGSINQKDLKSIPVLNPHQEIIALFNKFIFDIDNKIKNNVKENQQLEKIRDLLLPKLLSGELLNE